jgi:hypothetical protein
MNWQDVLVGAFAFVAAIYLVRTWRAHRARSAGCASCPAVKALRSASGTQEAAKSNPR